MKKLFVIAAGIVVAAATTADAQNGGLSAPVCTSNGSLQQNVAQDVCQQGYDVFQFMAPQLGVAVAGGSHVLGSNSTLGGLGHFSIGLRANALRAAVPAVDRFSPRTSGATPSRELPTQGQFVGLPAADVAIGVFGGLPLALTNVGGVDVLLSATYVPTINERGVQVTPDNNVQFGYGARIGLLSESIIVPGVSLTFLKRDLPKTVITGGGSISLGPTGPTNYQFTMNDVSVNTSGWRLVASKNLLLFGVGAGVGQDKYEQSTSVSATVSGTLPTPFTQTISIPNTSQSLTRTNYFVNASMSLLLLKVTAEIGQVSGGTVNTYNTFESGRADKAQTYGSVGVRFGI
jgi:hypothetical protein